MQLEKNSPKGHVTTAYKGGVCNSNPIHIFWPNLGNIFSPLLSLFLCWFPSFFHVLAHMEQSYTIIVMKC